MTPHDTVWALWDADELVSIHLTEHDAHDARDQHLERYQAFPADGDLVQVAVEIRTSSLAPDERTLAQGRSR